MWIKAHHLKAAPASWVTTGDFEDALGGSSSLAEASSKSFPGKLLQISSDDWRQSWQDARASNGRKAVAL